MFMNGFKIECFDKKDVAFVYDSGFYSDTPIIVLTNESEEKYKGYCITTDDALSRVLHGESRFVKMYLDSDKTSRLLYDTHNEDYSFATFKGLLSEQAKKRILSKALFNDMHILPTLVEESASFDLPYNDKLGVEAVNRKIDEGKKLFKLELKSTNDVNNIGVDVKFLSDTLLLEDFTDASRILTEVSVAIKDLSDRKSPICRVRRAMMEILGDYSLNSRINNTTYKVYDVADESLMRAIKDGVYDDKFDDFKNMIKRLNKKE